MCRRFCILSISFISVVIINYDVKYAKDFQGKCAIDLVAMYMPRISLLQKLFSIWWFEKMGRCRVKMSETMGMQSNYVCTYGLRCWYGDTYMNVPIVSDNDMGEYEWIDCMTMGEYSWIRCIPMVSIIPRYTFPSDYLRQWVIVE